MNLTRNRLTVGATILSLVSAFTAFGIQPQSTDVRVLASGQTLEREMTGAESHLYKFGLKADEFFQVRVEQKGVDVTLKLMDSSGQVLATMDSPNGKAGPETLSFVAEKSGSFVMEVSGLDAKAVKGSYSVRREVSRTAVTMDKRRVEVERLFVEGLAARNTEGQREVAKKKLKEALAGWKELGDDYLTALTTQQLTQLAEVPPEINVILEGIKKELQDAQKLLGEGQQLMTRSNADSFPAREKLNQALASLRSVIARVTEKNLLDKVSQSGETASRSLNSLKIFEFYSKAAEALSLQGIAQTHANLGERQDSIDATKEANSVYQEIISDKTFLTISGIDVKNTIQNGKFFYASGLGSIGRDLDQYFGKSAEAIAYLTQAVERYHSLYQETQNPQHKLQEAYTLALMGTIYGRESKTNDKAIEFLTRSLELFRTLPNEAQQVAATLSVIASRHSSNYDFKDALENWEKALAIYRKIDDKNGQSNILWQIGMMYWVLNDRPKVLEYTDQSLAILQSSDFVENWKKRLNPSGLGIFDELYGAFAEHERLDSIAIAYRFREDYQKSLEYYEEALTIAPALKDPRTVRLDLISIAYSFAKLERWDKAAESYKQALEISRKQGVSEDIADDLKDVGWTLMEADKSEEALRYQDEALSIYQAVGVDETKAFSATFSNLLNEISRSHYAVGNRRFAVFYGKRAVNAMQGERQRIQSLDAGSQKGFLEKKEKHYRRLADWLMDEGRIDEAKQVLAMLKEEEIHSFLRDGVSESDSQQRSRLNSEERDALNRYNALAERITVLGSQFGKLQTLKSRGVKLTEEQDESYKDLSSQLSAASSGFQVFLKQLAEEFAQRSTTKGDLNETFALQSKLKAWGAGVVFLYTLVGDDRYRVILVTPDTQVDGKHEITARELNDKIEKFRAAVQNPRLDPRPLGKELYDILIKPIEKQLEGAGAKTLLWSLDGNLRLLPLAALWDGKEYFGQKYQNVTITLASRDNLGDPAIPNWRALGLAVSQAKTVEVKDLGGTREFPFAALPGAGAEVRSIVKSKQSPNGVLPGLSLIDLEFNEAALEAELVRGYKIVHIASHLNLDPNDAAKSFLLLGDGTVLTVAELRNNPGLKFSGVELLTLSACKTAVVGKDSSGKEIEGFGYVAQQKGAKAILATLWSVADESTQLLMSEFYRLHQANPHLTKAAALQLAQQEMIAGKLEPKLTATGTTSPETKQEDTPERTTTDGEMDPASQLPSFPYDPKRPYAHPYYWAPFILIGNWK
jgi:CHAT domain-containing protein